MSAAPRRLVTEEQRERLYAARYRGGLCALCGRALDEGEPIYWEHFVVGRVGGITQHPQVPVGAECASRWLLEENADERPDPCAGCGRPVYYAVASANRRRAVCSQRCQLRVSRAMQPARRAED